jgi:hypothetical protein
MSKPNTTKESTMNTEWEERIAERESIMAIDGFPVGSRVRVLIDASTRIPEHCRFHAGDVGTVKLNLMHGPEKISVIFDRIGGSPHAISLTNLRVVS